MPFQPLGLAPELLRAIQKTGYLRPTPVQSATIPKVMRGHDLIAIAQTGTGKTAAFVLPLLHRLSRSQPEHQTRGTRALILAPTRELAVQIMENIRVYGQFLPIRVAAIFGGVDEEAQMKKVHKGVHVIVATPGRLIDLLDRQRLNFDPLEVLVLDEADRMLHMGFLPAIETIVGHLPKHRQTLMFSATFPKEVESLAHRFQHQPKTIEIGHRSDPAATVSQSVYEVPQHLKTALLIELLRKPEFRRVLVFVRMKDGVNVLTEALKLARVKVARLHSGRTQEQRLKALQDFKDGNVQVLVATDIVARGIDIENVTQVINYDFPVNPEDYIHRIGRTGRAGSEGEAISLVPRGDLNLLGIVEFAIEHRLPRKKLKGFDYHAKTPAPAPGAKPPKRDWRKRTREMEAKRPLRKEKKRGKE
ncbi:MAG: DEAD/DEAH box helicase [Luteolibacter sp.]